MDEVDSPFATDEIYELIDELRSLPSTAMVPRAMLDELEAEHRARFGPTQRAFIERHAASLLPGNGGLLFDLLDDPVLCLREREFVDLYLGSPPSVTATATLIVWSFEDGRHGLWDYGLDLLLERRDRASELARVLPMLKTVGLPKPRLKPIARIIVDAAERDDAGASFDREDLELAWRLSGRRKQAANKKPANKKPANKKPATAQPRSAEQLSLIDEQDGA